MAGRYEAEIGRLSETFSWAATVDLEPLRQAIRTASVAPLRAVGSGGSLTGAHALAHLHQRYTGRLASIATPLEAVGESLEATTGTWLLSAGGSNVDIVEATRRIIFREPRQLAVLCGRDPSPLATLCRQHQFVDLLLYSPPTGKDGFLATNSLLAVVALLTRAYTNEFRSADYWQGVVDYIEPLLHNKSPEVEAWHAATARIWKQSTTLVLHGPSTQVGAVDLESKFTEAALGHIKIADYRNFAHGRHHWLAKRSDTSAVLAFITDEDRVLADHTLDLMPANVSKARLVFHGDPTMTGLASLLAALRITGWAGVERHIDPGRPGVPTFGRRLYRLRVRGERRPRTSRQLTRRDAAAIARKAGVECDSLAASGDLAHWRAALATFLDRLRSAEFAGVVLDYDGTLVDTRCRFMPVSATIAGEIVRLVEAGAYVAIASGRGVSVRRDLRKQLPPAIWPSILVGYYNGAEIAPLDNDDVPNRCGPLCASLRPVATALSRRPDLASCVHRQDRPFQITLEAHRTVPTDRLWEFVREVVASVGAPSVTITQSGHSIDILGSGVSKKNVVAQVREVVGDAPVLAIGDRGRWPGNDYDLLREAFALSVDEISRDPNTCWHVGEPGQRGPPVTLDYLCGLAASRGHLAFRTTSLR